jgi:hypothetical protein
MKFRGRGWCLFGGILLLMVGVAAALTSLFRGPPEPVYSGTRLSVWAEKVYKLNDLASIVDTNYPEVQAMRAIGTNAIPWLVSELKRPRSLAWRLELWRLNNLLQKQQFIKYRFPGLLDAQKPQSRARAGFWALGEIARPAIPSLMGLVEQEPNCAPSALAGIGASGLAGLHHCLSNVPPPNAKSAPNARAAASALGGLYVAIDVGRISRSEASYLLPVIQSWAQVKITNSDAAFWAEGVLREFDFMP